MTVSMTRTGTDRWRRTVPQAAADEAEDPAGRGPDDLLRPEPLDVRRAPGAQLATGHRWGTPRTRSMPSPSRRR